MQKDGKQGSCCQQHSMPSCIALSLAPILSLKFASVSHCSCFVFRSYRVFLLNLQQLMVFVLLVENECQYTVIKQSVD